MYFENVGFYGRILRADGENGKTSSKVTCKLEEYVCHVDSQKKL